MNPLSTSCRMQGQLGEKQGIGRFSMSKVDFKTVVATLPSRNSLYSNSLKFAPLVQLLPTRSARVVQVIGS